MKILAVDQARSGAWAIFNYEKRLLLRYGTFKFDAEHYTFPRAIMEIEKLIWGVISRYRVDAVFLEDIQLRANVQSFKKLAQLQGVLVNTLERHDYLYDLIQPTAWQNYCNARGRSSAEAKKKLTRLENEGKKKSKILSIQFVQDNFGINTENDNLADAVCMGWYVVNQIKIETEKGQDKRRNQNGKEK